jgi:colicin import membrane protein
VNWRSTPPAPQLAIEGNIVRYEDLPPSVRKGKPLREPTPPPATPPRVEQPVEPEPAPDVDLKARQQAEALEREQARLAAEREAENQRAAEVQRAKNAEALELKEAEALAAKQRAADAAKAKEAQAAKQRADDEAKAKEALAARQRQAEQEQAARDSKQRAEREAELQRALATEEEGEAFARSGVVDEYRALLVQTIERNWNKPPSARAGLKCMLYVTQATGGTVLDVRIGECNGDQAVRESVAIAVQKSSPLPAPRDPRAFQRQLEINFEPKE